MKVLVTGGSGFIGSNLAAALVARGDDVRIVDNFATGRRVNLAKIREAPNLELLEYDITDPFAMARAMAGVEVVFHQAALPSVARSVAAPLESHRVNVTGTLNVLEAARLSGVRRVVYASSSSVYGDTPVLPKVETMPTSPRSPYAVSKLAGESYCAAYFRAYGLETVSLRYFNVFGPNQDPQSQYAAALPKFITAAIRNESPVIYGDGTQSRDFCFVENVVSANLLAAAAPASACGKTFNVAGGQRIDLLGVLRRLEELSGHPVTPRFEPVRAGDVKHSLADIQAARTELGYGVLVPFAEGLQRAYEWYARGPA